MHDLLRRSCNKVHDVLSYLWSCILLYILPDILLYFLSVWEKNVVKNRITHEDYKKMFTISQRTGENDECNKKPTARCLYWRGYKVGLALSAEDDKRVIMEDGIHTLAYGHYRLKNWRNGKGVYTRAGYTKIYGFWYFSRVALFPKESTYLWSLFPRMQVCFPDIVGTPSIFKVLWYFKERIKLNVVKWP